MTYAVNTTTPVIYVPGNTYYAVNNGVWFMSANATGPWAVATTVPPVIYTIPPSSPLHYVTYVQVYGYTPERGVRGLHAGLLRHGGFVRRRRGLRNRLLLPALHWTHSLGARSLHLRSRSWICLERDRRLGAGLWHGHGDRLLVQSRGGVRSAIGDGDMELPRGAGAAGEARRQPTSMDAGVIPRTQERALPGRIPGPATSAPALAAATTTR